MTSEKSTNQVLFDRVCGDLRAQLGGFADGCFVDVEQCIYATIQGRGFGYRLTDETRIYVKAHGASGDRHFSTNVPAGHYKCVFGPQESFNQFFDVLLPQLREHFGLTAAVEFDPIAMGA